LSGGRQGDGGVLGALLDGGVCSLCWAGRVHAIFVGDILSNALTGGAEVGMTRCNGVEVGDVFAIPSQLEPSLVLTRLRWIVTCTSSSLADSSGSPGK
jgi:hypothetical protein